MKSKEPLAKLTLVGPTSMISDVVALCMAQKVPLAINVEPLAQMVAPVEVPQIIPTTGRNTVVYRVADLNTPSGESRAIIHAYLLRHQAAGKLCSAREVRVGTGLGQKAVESAIHAMKVERIIQSIQIGRAHV